MTRRQMRENCFILLFERCFTDEPAEEILSLAEECDAVKLDNVVRQYFTEIDRSIGQIDGIIEKNLKNWSMGRLSKVALSVLRLAVYELCILGEIDDAIVINEAIEIAKEYSSQEEAAYINGVLGGVVRGAGEKE